MCIAAFQNEGQYDIIKKHLVLEVKLFPDSIREFLFDSGTYLKNGSNAVTIYYLTEIRRIFHAITDVKNDLES